MSADASKLTIPVLDTTTVGLAAYDDASGAARRSRQRLLAITLPVSAGLLWVGSAATPKGLDQLITSTAIAARVLPLAHAHTSQLYFSNLLLLFGLGALGNVLAGFNLAGFNLAAAVSAHLPTAEAERYLVTTFTSTAGVLLLIVYLTGMLVGAMLMAVALWRSNCVPRWLPPLFVLGCYAARAGR